MRVLLLASYCDENGCCDALPCEDCLVMCNVVEIDSTGQIKRNDGGYSYLRDMVKEDNALDEEATPQRCDTVSCDICPYEDKCLGE